MSDLGTTDEVLEFAIGRELEANQFYLVLANQINRDDSITKILYYLAVPSDLNSLAHRPWTLLTYMFTHGYLYHILFNVLILFWFGQFFIQEFGKKKLVGIYLLGGFAGAVLYAGDVHFAFAGRPCSGASHHPGTFEAGQTRAAPCS